jgi:hypothetical protein
MRNIPDKIVEKIKKTHILYSIIFSFKYDVNVIMWKYVVKPDRAQIAI